MKRILVSLEPQISATDGLIPEDVIVLTSMGEEVAIEAKEAPKA